MARDSQTLSMLFSGPAEKAPRKPSHKFAVGMAVTYCGKPATIVGKQGRVWLVECEGKTWNSRGKDMVPA